MERLKDLIISTVLFLGLLFIKNTLFRTAVLLGVLCVSMLIHQYVRHDWFLIVGACTGIVITIQTLVYIVAGIVNMIKELFD